MCKLASALLCVFAERSTLDAESTNSTNLITIDCSNLFFIRRGGELEEIITMPRHWCPTSLKIQKKTLGLRKRQLAC